MPLEPSDPPCVIAFISDLLFETKVRGTSTALSIPYVNVRSVKQLTQALDGSASSLVLVDLEADGSDVLDSVRVARGHASSPHVLAFCSHVAQDLADLAQQAGAHDVWPRSRFSAQLPDLLSDHCLRTDQS